MRDVIDIQIVSDIDEDAKDTKIRNLDFYWNVTSFTRDEVDIQCHFDESIYVSSSSEPDTIQVRFVETSLFFDFAGQNLEQGTTLTRQIPPQLQLESVHETLG